MPRMTLSEAREVVAEVLVKSGTMPENAASVARALVVAESDGLKGHGLSRLQGYAAQVRAGKIDGSARPVPSRPTGASLLIDAAHGFAYPALDLAVDLLPEMARAQGVAVAAIRRSHHCGAAGLVVERLAEQGLVGLMFANTPAAIAPWGGMRAVFGTNPIAFACPLPDTPPLVIDLSLSKVARGNIMAAKQKGVSIPDDWALDAQGQPTTDPVAALAGTMLPVGGAKGTVLALMVELLAAGLTGANYAVEASSFLDTEGPPPGTGQLIVAFDPELLGGPGAVGRFGALAESIAGQKGARIPGTRRHAARERATGAGIEVDQGLLA